MCSVSHFSVQMELTGPALSDRPPLGLSLVGNGDKSRGAVGPQRGAGGG